MNREKFIKLMMLTTSDQDGEALTALRKANAMLAAENKNWEEFLAVGAGPSSTNYGVAKYTDPKVIDPIFEKLFREVPYMSGFRDFVNDVYQFWLSNHFLTEKQFQALNRAASR
jgi:hypothetical protein